MLMAHDLRIGAPRLRYETRPAVQELAMASKTRARRRWAMRSVLLLAFTAVVLCGLLIWRRNQATQTEFHRQLAPTVAALQERINALGTLPVTPPTREFLNTYTPADAVERQFALNASEPVMIGWTAGIHLFLQEDGRWVIFYSGGKVSCTWMTQSAFRTAQVEQMRRVNEFQEQRSRRPVELP